MSQTDGWGCQHPSPGGSRAQPVASGAGGPGGAAPAAPRAARGAGARRQRCPGGLQVPAPLVASLCTLFCRQPSARPRLQRLPPCTTRPALQACIAGLAADCRGGGHFWGNHHRHRHGGPAGQLPAVRLFTCTQRHQHHRCGGARSCAHAAAAAAAAAALLWQPNSGLCAVFISLHALPALHACPRSPPTCPTLPTATSSALGQG